MPSTRLPSAHPSKGAFAHAAAAKAAAKEGFKVASQEAAMIHETASNLQEMAEKEVVNMQERILKWKQRILNRNVTKCKRILRRKL